MKICWYKQQRISWAPSLIITCKMCKDQYIGGTNDMLRSRCTVRHISTRQLGVSQHIDECSNGQFTITLFFKIPENKIASLQKESNFVRQFAPSLNGLIIN